MTTNLGELLTVKIFPVNEKGQIRLRLLRFRETSRQVEFSISADGASRLATIVLDLVDRYNRNVTKKPVKKPHLYVVKNDDESD